MRRFLVVLLIASGASMPLHALDTLDAADIVQDVADTSADQQALAQNLLLVATPIRWTDIPLSSALLDTALQLSDPADTLLTIRIMIQRGVNDWYAGNYLTALSRYSEALELAEEADYKSEIGSLHHLIGTVYERQRNGDRALESFRKAYVIRSEFGSAYHQAKTIQNIGSVFTDLNQFDSATYYIEQSIALLEAQDRLGGLAVSYKLMGECLLKAGRLDEAVPWFEKSLKGREEIDNELGKTFTLNSFAQLRLQQGRYDESIALAREAITLGERVQSGDQRARSYRILAKCLAAQGKTGEAFSALLRHTELKDSLTRNQFSAQLNEMLALFEVNEREKEIALGEAALDKAEAKLQRERVWRNAIMAIGALVLLSAGVVIWSFRRRLASEKKLAKVQLEEQQRHEEVQSLQFMIKGQEEERYRIGREIHDALGSRLGSLRFYIERLLDAQASDREKLVNEAGSTVDGVIDEVRRISANMMPGALKKFGLHAALSQLTDDLKERSQLDVNFHSTNNVKLDDETEMMLYRIIQEATNNVVKHAEASEVDIVLSREDDRIVLSVQDNGKGFETNKVQNGSGLASMETRVQIMNGQLEVESTPGEGTSLLISIPTTNTQV